MAQIAKTLLALAAVMLMWAAGFWGLLATFRLLPHAPEADRPMSQGPCPVCGQPISRHAAAMRAETFPLGAIEPAYGEPGGMLVRSKAGDLAYVVPSGVVPFIDGDPATPEAAISWSRTATNPAATLSIDRQTGKVVGASFRDREDTEE